MSEKLKDCWEIKGCGRQKGGPKAAQLGVCIASAEGLGHSCWAIAGTLCGGEVQGTAAQKEQNCRKCSVYVAYNRQTGPESDRVKQECVAEQAKYNKLMTSRLGSTAKA